MVALTAAAPPAEATVATAVAAASDLGYVLRPLHWTAILRHPRSAAGSARLFRLCTVILAGISFSFFCSEVAVMCLEGTADLDAFTLTLSVANTTITWLIRLAHIVKRERDFQKLAQQVGQDFSQFLTADDLPLLQAEGRASRRFTLTYVWFGIAACAFSMVSPVSPEGLPFIVALPFDATTPLGFAIAWLFCTLVTIHVVVMTMVFDAFNVSLIAQLRMQVMVLNRKLVKIAKEHSSKPLDSLDTTDYRDLHFRLRKCVLHHQAIIRNADLLQSCLGAMLLGQSISIGTVACFQMFQVTMVLVCTLVVAGLLPLNTPKEKQKIKARINKFDHKIPQESANGMQQMGKFGCYLTAMLAELFIYCWFGDDLITEEAAALNLRSPVQQSSRQAQSQPQPSSLFQQPQQPSSLASSSSRLPPALGMSENLALAAYDAATSLQGCPLSIKKSLVLMMNRAQRSLKITAGGFFPLSRESFVSVVNVSYSFSAVLRNFKEEQE